MQDHTPRPQTVPTQWIDALARADEDVAAGRTVPASVVHAVLDESLARLCGRATKAEDEPAPAT